jgi:hypothetical protein
MAQLILEEFNKMEAWSLLSSDATHDCKEMLPSSSKYKGYVLLSLRQEHEDVEGYMA